MPPKECQPMARFVPRIFFGVTASKSVVDFMVGQSAGHIQGFKTGFGEPKGEVQVFRAEWIKNSVKAAQLAEEAGSNHHRTAARDARFGPIVLPAVELAEAHRPGLAKDKVDATAAPIVDPVAFV